ncbi:hypothetical protein MMC11_000970 [Xylographa trunciseda]|nr:hypothetical protein [Xylographa trunciseda]
MDSPQVDDVERLHHRANGDRTATANGQDMQPITSLEEHSQHQSMPSRSHEDAARILTVHDEGHSGSTMPLRSNGGASKLLVDISDRPASAGRIGSNMPSKERADASVLLGAVIGPSMPVTPRIALPRDLRRSKAPSSTKSEERRGLSGGVQTPSESAAPASAAERSRIYVPTAAHHEVTVLQQHVTSAKLRLAQSLDIVSTRTLTATSYEKLLHFGGSQRLKCMPHQGSRLDRYLKKADYFVKCIRDLARATAERDHYANEAAQVIYGCIRLLLRGTGDTAVLERVFSALDEQGDIIKYILGGQYQSSAPQRIVVLRLQAFIAILDLCTEITVLYNPAEENSRKLFLLHFESRFGLFLRALADCKLRFTTEAWNAVLEGLEGLSGISIQIIRSWLSSSEGGFLGDIANGRGLVSTEEFTCEWLPPVIQGFVGGRKDVLLIIGEPGSGKTMAMGSILDYARFNSHKGAKLLHFGFDTSPPFRRSSLHLVKTFLLQLLEQSLGNTKLYQRLCEAYSRIEERHEPDGEGLLWKIFTEESRLQTQNMLIVLDGLDHIEAGARTASQIRAQLRAVLKDRQNLKCIILSRPIEGDVGSDEDLFVLGPKVFEGDIRRYIEQLIQKSRAFKLLTLQEREAILRRVMGRPFASFLEAQLLLGLLEMEGTYSRILRLLDLIPRSLFNLVEFICQRIDRGKNQTLLLLSTLLVAERPFTVREIQILLETSTETRQYTDTTGLENRIRKDCCGLVEVRGNLVQFVNASVKQHILQLSSHGIFPLDVQDAHRRLTLRCMAYIKDNFPAVDVEPSFQPVLEPAIVQSIQEKIKKDTLLGYSVHYYMVHYVRSGLKSAWHNNSASENIRVAFIDSVALTNIEIKVWEQQYSLREVERMLADALSLRKFVLGAQKRSVVQGLINLGRYKRRLGSDVEAMKLYLEAWTLSRRVLGEDSAVALASAKAYLEISVHISRSEIEFDDQIEGIYTFLWNASKDRNGITDEDALHYGGLLGSLYFRFQRYQDASNVYREIYQALFRRYGGLHDLTTRYVTLLLEALELLQKYDECTQISEVLLGAAEGSLDPWDSIRLAATMRFAAHCELQRAYRKAEGALRSLWKTLLGSCRSGAQGNTDAAFLDITLQLCEFLGRRSKSADAASVLVELWHVFDQPSRRSSLLGDDILIKLRHVAEHLMKFDNFQTATSILLRLRVWYEESFRGACDEAVLVVICLSKCYRHSDDHRNEETILRGLFDILVRGTTLDGASVKICVELLSLYEKSSKWSEAIDVCIKVLSRLWAAILTKDTSPISLPSVHREEAILLAVRLASFYIKLTRKPEAESLHVRIYKAFRSNYSIDAIELVYAAERLAKFYQEIGHFDDAIKLWKELQQEAFKVLGRRHNISIKISFILAQLCRLHRRDESMEILLDIISAFGNGAEACQPDSVDALLELLRLLEEQNNVNELRRWYSIVWAAFRTRGPKCGLGGDTFSDIFTSYLAILTKDHNIAEMIKLASEFRALYVSLYGAHHILSLKASFQLAGALESERARHEEAVEIYEEIVHISVEVSEDREALLALIWHAKERLAVLFAGGSGRIERAEDLYIEVWEASKRQSGCTHDRTLKYLAQIIKFYAGRKSRDSISSALSLLEKAIIEILSKEKDSFMQFKAAEHIAKMYMTIESRQSASRLLDDLRLEFSNEEHPGPSRLDRFRKQLRILDRQCFVFILALDEILKGNVTMSLFTDVIRELMTETSLYEFWLRVSKSAQSLEICLSAGTRLMVYLELKGRRSEQDRIRNEVWNIFRREFGADPAQSGFLWDLFLTCISQINHDEASISILEAAVAASLGYYSSAQFQQCYDLSLWIHGFVGQRGGWSTPGSSALGLKLAVCLAGRSSSLTLPAGHLAELIHKLSLEIMDQILKAGLDGIGDVEGLPKGDINTIILMLGRRKDYHNLERILRRLWESRMKRNWAPSTVISVGTRLCEVQFAAGHRDDAISFIEDICYNVRNALGPLSAPTIRCETLRAKFYTTCGYDSMALGVHADLLRETARAARSGEVLDHVPGSANRDAQDLTSLGLHHTKLLRFSLQRHSKSGVHDTGMSNEYSDIVRGIKERFARADQRWYDVNVEDLNLESWAHGNEMTLPRTEETGYWITPSEWTLEGIEEGDDEEVADEKYPASPIVDHVHPHDRGRVTHDHQRSGFDNPDASFNTDDKFRTHEHHSRGGIDRETKPYSNGGTLPPLWDDDHNNDHTQRAFNAPARDDMQFSPNPQMFVRNEDGSCGVSEPNATSYKEAKTRIFDSPFRPISDSAVKYIEPQEHHRLAATPSIYQRNSSATNGGATTAPLPAEELISPHQTASDLAASSDENEDLNPGSQAIDLPAVAPDMHIERLDDLVPTFIRDSALGEGEDRLDDLQRGNRGVDKYRDKDRNSDEAATMIRKSSVRSGEVGGLAGDVAGGVD